MKRAMFTGVAVAMFAAIFPASAADDPGLTRMALCQDSWAEWTKKEPKTFESFRNLLRDRQSFVQGHRARGDPLSQRRALN